MPLTMTRLTTKIRTFKTFLTNQKTYATTKQATWAYALKIHSLCPSQVDMLDINVLFDVGMLHIRATYTLAAKMRPGYRAMPSIER